MAAFAVLCVILLSGASAAVIGLEITSSTYRLAVLDGRKKTESIENAKIIEEKDACVAFSEEGRRFGLQAMNSTTICGFSPYFRSPPHPHPLSETTIWAQNSAGNWVTQLDQQIYTSEELMAMTLEHIRKTMEERFAGERVEYGVVVPSYWTRTQRIAILQVAEMVGMKVLGVVQRTGTAALAYGFTRFDNETAHYGVMFDLAKDGLEVSLVKFNATNKKTVKVKNVESIEILANAHSVGVSGTIIDERLALHVADQFEPSLVPSLKRSLPSMSQILHKVPSIKQGLIRKDVVKVIFEHLYDGKDLKGEVKIANFRDILMNFREEIVATVERALREGNVTKEEVKSLVLVGKDSRDSVIQDILHELFSDSITTSFLEDSTASQGAALFAANLTSQFQMKPVWLTDVSPYDIRVDFEGEDGFRKSLGLFAKGVKVGAKRQLSFTHDRSVKCVLALVKDGLLSPFLSISTSGAEDFSRKYSQKPTQVFTFIYDSNGIANLKWAEVRGEVEEVNKTAETKKEETPTAGGGGEMKNETGEGNSTANSTIIRKVTASLDLVPLELDVPPPLTPSDFKMLSIRLHELAAIDHDAALKKEAKEKLLAGIEAMKKLLLDKNYLRVVTDSEKAELIEAVKGTEEWVRSEEMKKVESWTVTERLLKLQNAFKESQERLDELLSRPQAIRDALNELSRLNATMSDLNLTKTWVPQKDKDEVFTRLNEAKDWINRVEKDHKERKPWENPLVKVAQIQSKVMGAGKNVERIKKTQRPKPQILKEKKEKVGENTENTVGADVEASAVEAPKEEPRDAEATKGWEECKGDECGDATVPRTEL